MNTPTCRGFMPELIDFPEDLTSEGSNCNRILKVRPLLGSMSRYPRDSALGCRVCGVMLGNIEPTRGRHLLIKIPTSISVRFEQTLQS